MTLLHCQDLALKSQSGRSLLANCTCSLEAAKLHALIGPNGAGKSSLIKVLSGEANPHQGSLTLDGKTLGDWPRQALAQRRAVLSQANPLQFAFSAYQVVAMGRSPHSSSARENLRLVQEALRILDCEDFAQQSYPTLSGGEQQRVQLARVICQVLKPENERLDGQILLLDEPTNALDVQHQYALMQHLQKLTQRGLSVLMVIHDFNLAAQYADELWLMHQGKLVDCGPANQVLAQENIKNVFKVDSEIHAHPSFKKPWVFVKNPTL